ncbi:hypothetical protein F5Y03DRAFT_404665 [Xylaria venustula]|nr:hypothetical protein F5Y03DRAFT_404665 [Xylaria venustula]
MATKNSSSKSAAGSASAEKPPLDRESICSDTPDGQESDWEAESDESDELVLHAGWPTGCICEKKNLYLPWWEISKSNYAEYPFYVGSDGVEDVIPGRFAILLRKRDTPWKSAENIEMVIQSPYLVEFLRKKLPDCPEVIKAGFPKEFPQLIFRPPFDTFVIHRSRLMKALDKEYDPETGKHIRKLLEVVKNEEKASYDAIKVAKEEGVVSFRDIWTIFEPECLVYTTYHYLPVAMRLLSAAYKLDHRYKAPKYEITCERLVWDGKQWVWASSTYSIPYFDGTKLIIDLICFPLAYYPDKEQLTGLFLARGRKVETLTGYHLKQYKGMRIGTASYNPGKASWMGLDDRIIIHDDAYKASIIVSERPLRPLEHTPTSFDIQAENVGNAEQTDHNSDQPVNLSEQQLIVCTPIVRGYSTLEPRHNLQFFVDQISDLSYDKTLIDRLFLPDNTKKMVLSIAKRGEGGFDRASMLARGKRLVVLLFGNPGTGKLMTAYAVAEYRQVPCLRVDLRGCKDYNEMRLHLLTMFQSAQKTQSVLLLDKCNEALKQRTAQDVHRSQLVLDLFELIMSFEGLVFIATSVIEEIDHELRMVISFCLTYPDLDAETRIKIWKQVLDRETEHTLSYSDIAQLAMHKINGHIIRRVMDAAIHLANIEEERLAYEHITRILENEGLIQY